MKEEIQRNPIVRRRSGEERIRGGGMEGEKKIIKAHMTIILHTLLMCVGSSWS